MNVIVTGAAGFIGSHVVDRLLAEGHRVTAVDNFDRFYDERIKRSNVAAHLRDPRYRLLELDIRDLGAMRDQLRGEYDAIVHLAARTGVRPSLLEPMDYTDVNVVGTQNLLELARERGVPQFVFGSSSSIFGTNPEGPWQEDLHLPRPISPYAGTKLCAEALGHVYSQLWGMRFLALRFFTVYGPRQRPDLAIHKFARLMLSWQPIPVYGQADTGRDYTYVDDVVDGIMSALRYDASAFEVLNLGNDHVIGLRRVISTLERVLGVRARLQRLPEQPGDVPQTWAHIGKARELLGYAPRVSFDEGMERFGAWLCRPMRRVAGGEPAPVRSMPGALG